MKNESEFTQEFIGHLKKYYPQLTVVKHCDRFTTGVPDLSISVHGKTCWVEVKFLRELENSVFQPSDWVDNKVQLELCLKLEGLYYIYHKALNLYVATYATCVKSCLRDGVPLTGSAIHGAGKGFNEVSDLILRRLNEQL